MQYDVRADLKQAERYLIGLRKDQIPFATAYALTQTAKQAQQAIIGEMKSVFDRPKPYTLNGTFIKIATKRDLVAVVKLKDGYTSKGSGDSKRGTPDKYLAPQVEGGPRRPKAFEKLLVSQGVMPPGYFAVPTKAAPKDAYGNVPSGFYTRILSQLGIGDPFQRARKKAVSGKPRRRVRPPSSSPIDRREAFNRSERRRKQRRLAQVTRPKARPKYPIFSVYPNREKNKHLEAGIWERVGSGGKSTVRPLFLFVDSPPRYRKRLEFNRVVMDTIDSNLIKNFEAGFIRAQATQRPLN